MTARNPSRRGYLDGKAFVPHRLEMMASPAWRLMPKPLARIIERLEIEHLRHGGAENGGLCVSYEQFVQYGVSRRMICTMEKLGEALGLIEVRKDHNWAGDIRPPNVYRLTFLPEKGKRSPTDEWSYLKEETVRALVLKARPAVSGEPAKVANAA